MHMLHQQEAGYNTGADKRQYFIPFSFETQKCKEEYRSMTRKE